MSVLKLIFKGRLEFGNPRSFELAVKQFQNRVETVYRSDLLLKPEEIFDADNFTFGIPNNNLVATGGDKSWRTTCNFLREIAQFAVAGNVKAWCMSEGNLIDHKVFEPSENKAIAKDFYKGRALTEKKGHENEAKEALNRAIERYQNHALAYERRGYVNYRLGNYKDALYDFTKSVDINPHQAEAFFGRGKVKLIKQDWQGAFEDFEAAMKKSIALQPFFWQARRGKGEALMHLKRYDEAIFEFGKYLDRKFKPEDPNKSWRRKVSYLHGKASMESGKPLEAIEYLNKALAIEEGHEFTSDASIIYARGLAQQKLGKRDFFKKDLIEAARQGHAEATKMLADI